MRRVRWSRSIHSVSSLGGYIEIEPLTLDIDRRLPAGIIGEESNRTR
jgi:hypothetical protein